MGAFSGVLHYLILCWLVLYADSVFAASVSTDAIDSAAPAINRPVSDKWALIVGISKFADPSLNLKYPAKDAKDFYQFLINDEKFAPDHVRLLTDEQATREHILDELGDKWLPRVAGRDDVVIIYISSHGSPSDLDVGGVNYIVAYDTDKNRLYSTGIAMQDMCRIVKARVHTDRAVLMLDACHSGAAVPEGKGLVRTGNVDVEEIAQGTGQLVISSSEPSQVSWESKDQPNSVFTRYLIAGLRANGPNTTLAEAYNYMKEKVEDEVRRDRGILQTPVLKGKWTGNELVLAVPPSRPRPGLPETPPAPAPLPQSPSPSPSAVAVAPSDQKSSGTSQSPASAQQADQNMAQPAPAKAQNRIAVVEVKGPLSVETDDSLGYRLRSGGKGAPSEGEFAVVSDGLRDRLCEKLTKIFPDKVVPPEELLDVQSGRESGGSLHWKKIAKLVGAKYLVHASIASVLFKGHSLTGEEYEMAVSARMEQADTGSVVWRMNEKTFNKRAFGDKRDPIDYFQQVLAAEVAGYIAERLQKAIGGL